MVSTFLKAESPWSPCSVALHGEDLYVLEHINANSEAHEDWPPRVRRVGRDGKVTTLVTFAPARAATAAESRLADAVEKSDRAALRALLKQHADVNAPQADGLTAL